MSETQPSPADMVAGPRVARVGDLDPAFVTRFLSGMPPDLAQSFDARMLFAVQQRIGPWNGLERRRGWHVRLPLPGGAVRLSLTRDRAGHRAARPARSALAGAALGVACSAAAWLALG